MNSVIFSRPRSRIGFRINNTISKELKYVSMFITIFHPSRQIPLQCFITLNFKNIQLIPNHYNRLIFYIKSLDHGGSINIFIGNISPSISPDILSIQSSLTAVNFIGSPVILDTSLTTFCPYSISSIFVS